MQYEMSLTLVGILNTSHLLCNLAVYHEVWPEIKDKCAEVEGVSRTQDTSKQMGRSLAN